MEESKEGSYKGQEILVNVMGIFKCIIGML